MADRMNLNTIANKEDGRGRIRASVLVTERNRPLQGKRVLFLLQGPGGERPQQRSTSDGRANCEWPDLDSGNYVIIAECEGLERSRSETIERERLTPKPKPATLEVQVSGNPGRWFLLISVADENGQLVPNCIITITFDGEKQLRNGESPKTDPDGTLALPVERPNDTFVKIVVGHNTEETKLMWHEGLSGTNNMGANRAWLEGVLRP